MSKSDVQLKHAIISDIKSYTLIKIKVPLLKKTLNIKLSKIWDIFVEIVSLSQCFVFVQMYHQRILMQKSEDAQP